MIPSIYCPICERVLGKNEALAVGYDAIGTLIVHHLVPETVPVRSSESDDEFRRGIVEAGDLDIESNHTICGRAGFRSLTVGS